MCVVNKEPITCTSEVQALNPAIEPDINNISLYTLLRLLEVKLIPLMSLFSFQFPWNYYLGC